MSDQRYYYRPRYNIGATEILILINVIMFIFPSLLSFTGLKNLADSIINSLVLNINLPENTRSIVPFTLETGAYWQLLTSMFMHGNILHIFFNMYGLYIFGKNLEIRWGKAKFISYYLTIGILANIASALFFKFVTIAGNKMAVQLLGASGAVFGIVLAFASYNPNAVLLLYFIIPLKVKWAVMLFAGIELISEVTQARDGIAHITHLFGFLFGYLYLLLFFKINAIKEMFFDNRSNIYP